MDEYLPLKECKDNYVYKLISRNLRYGIYNKRTNGFTGIRTKFGERYLFEEIHYDADGNYGTAKPIKEICDFSLAREMKNLSDMQLLEQIEKEQNDNI